MKRLHRRLNSPAGLTRPPRSWPRSRQRARRPLPDMIDRMTRDGQDAPHRPARTVGPCSFGMKKFFFAERAVVQAVQDLVSARGIQPACSTYSRKIRWSKPPRSSRLRAAPRRYPPSSYRAQRPAPAELPARPPVPTATAHPAPPALPGLLHQLRPQRRQVPGLVQHAGNGLTAARLDNARYLVADELVVVEAQD